jgi:hypothetical protein
LLAIILAPRVVAVVVVVLVTLLFFFFIWATNCHLHLETLLRHHHLGTLSLVRPTILAVLVRVAKSSLGTLGLVSPLVVALGVLGQVSPLLVVLSICPFVIILSLLGTLSGLVRPTLLTIVLRSSLGTLRLVRPT